LAATAELVDVPSVSYHEAGLADLVEARLRRAAYLEVTRIADNVIARTRLGRPRRIVLGGHLDTVPPNGNERARIEPDAVWGLGSADMKGGLAVMPGRTTGCGRSRRPAPSCWPGTRPCSASRPGRSSRPAARGCFASR
jgi:hypothetical protein